MGVPGPSLWKLNQELSSQRRPWGGPRCPHLRGITRPAGVRGGHFLGLQKDTISLTKRGNTCNGDGSTAVVDLKTAMALLHDLLVPAMLARHGRLDAPGCRAPWPKMTLLLTVCPANVRTSPWRDATSPHTLIPLHTRCQPLHTFTLAPHRNHHHHLVRNHVF